MASDGTRPRAEVHGDPGAPRVAWFVHGILGQGRNWRSFARRMAEATAHDAAGAWRVFLPDLRGHGASPPSPPPHTLAACVDDLIADLPAPDLVVGHSFGGKVALRAFADGRVPDRAVGVILDSPPGPVLHRSPRGPSDPLAMLPRLRALPGEVPDREIWRAALRADGVPEAIVAWLLTSAVRRGDAWAWVWDLGVVEALLDDYFRADFRPFLARVDPLPSGAPRIVTVRAGRSDRWPAEEGPAAGPGVAATTLPNAGHWVHVDDPDGTFAVVVGAARAAGVS